jgi:DNA-binding response OmpR family regulator
VGSNASQPVVLVVDDEEDVADTYALRLQSDYETRVAYGGEEALELIDDDVDAVLLDRRMPDIHGDDVLAEIRDRGHDCAVIMSTAVDPDLNILEMDFDDYLCKPIFRETLLETLDQHIDHSTEESESLDRFLSIISKIDVLKEELSVGELKESEEYQRLQTEAKELAPKIREEVDDLDEMLETYRSIERESS